MVPTTEILPEIGVIEAILLFRRLGIDVTGLSPDAIRAVRRDLIHRHHPDLGGNIDLAKQINAAYDLVKNGVPKYRGTALGLKSFRRKYQTRREQLAALKLCYPDYPEWAWSGFSAEILERPRIYNQDFTDTNFIKKSMWELSGRSEAEYTIRGFDGHLFRGKITVFGAPSIFNYMADAMLTWQCKGIDRHACRAVFVHEESTTDLFLIYADGKYYGEARLKMKTRLFNVHPMNDPDFLGSLPDLLEQLKGSQGALDKTAPMQCVPL